MRLSFRLTTKHFHSIWFTIFYLILITSLNPVNCLPQASQSLSATNTQSQSPLLPLPSSSINSSIPSLTTSLLTTTLTSGRFPSGQRSSPGLSGSRSNNVLITQVRLTLSTSIPSASSTSTSNSTSNIDNIPRFKTNPDYSDSLPLASYIDPTFGILGALLILTGLATAFWGIRSGFTTCAVGGFYSGALIVICVILKLGVEKAINDPSKAVRGLFLLASLIAGALLGLLCLVFDTEGLFLSVTLAGFLLGLFIQALKPDGLISKIGYRFILYSSIGGIFFALNLIPNRKFKSVLAIISTSIIGSTAIILGIDCFTTSGLKEFYIRNLGFDQLFENKSYKVTDSQILNGTVIGNPIQRETKPFENGRWPLVTGEIIELSILGGLTLISIAFQLKMWSLSRKARENQKALDKESRRDRKKAEKAANRISKDAERELREWEIKHGYVKGDERNDVNSRKELEEDEIESTMGGGHKKSRSFMSLLPKALRSSKKKESNHELGERERTISVTPSQYQSSLGTSTMIGGSSPYTKNASLSSKTGQPYAYQTLPNVASPGTPDTPQVYDYLSAGSLPPKDQSFRHSIASTPPALTNSGSNRLSTTSIVGGHNRRASLLDYLRQGPVPGSATSPNVDGNTSVDDGRRLSNATLPPLDLGESIGMALPQTEVSSSERVSRERAKSVEHASLLEEIARLRGSIQQLKNHTPEMPPSGIGFTSASSVGMDRRRRNTIETATVMDLESEKPPTASFPNPNFPPPASSHLLRDITSSNSNTPSPATSSSWGNERRNSSGSMLNLNSRNLKNTSGGGNSGFEADSPSSGSGILPYNTQNRQTQHSHSKSQSFSRPTNPIANAKDRQRPKSTAFLDLSLQHPSPRLGPQGERRIIDTKEQAEARYAEALGRNPPKRSSTIQNGSSPIIPTTSSSVALTMAELREKHRLKLAKMQGGVTREMEEKEMLRKAKDEWEKRKEWEKKVWEEKSRRIESEKELLRLKEEELKLRNIKRNLGGNAGSSSPIPSPTLKATSSQEFNPNAFHRNEFNGGSLERQDKRNSGVQIATEWRKSLTTPGQSPVLQATPTLQTIHSRSRSSSHMGPSSSPLPSPTFGPTQTQYMSGSVNRQHPFPSSQQTSPNLNSSNRHSWFGGDQMNRPSATRQSTNNASFHTANSNSSPNTPLTETRPNFPSLPSGGTELTVKPQMQQPSNSNPSPQLGQINVPPVAASPSKRDSRRELSETDRRRMSQGAAGGDRAMRHRREMSGNALLKFDTNVVEEAWKNRIAAD